MHRIPAFAVSMGFFVGNNPTAAVVHAPALGKTSVAQRGVGAQFNGRPMQVLKTDRLAEAVLVTGFPYRRGELEHSNLENSGRFFFDVRGLRRVGSAALDLAWVADGNSSGRSLFGHSLPGTLFVLAARRLTALVREVLENVCEPTARRPPGRGLERRHPRALEEVVGGVVIGD